MNRRLLMFVASVSSAAFGFTAVLWLRSQFVADHVVWGTRVGDGRYTYTIFRSYTGAVALYVARYRFPAADRLKFVAGARGGRIESVCSWDAMSYERQRRSGVPGWGRRWRWNFGPPRAARRDDPPAVYWDVPGVRYTQWTITAPYWCLAVLFAPGPVLLVARRVRTRRRMRGYLCTACGYDLRASRNRCPECGTGIPPAPVDPASAP